MKRFILITFIISLALPGCATYTQMFINANGQMQRCGSYGSGLIGIATAQKIQNDCAGDLKRAGYIEIEKAGVIGIQFSDAKSDTLMLIKVFDNSPAKKQNLAAGDKVLEINGIPIKTQGDAKALLFSPIGTTVKLKILNSNGIKEVSMQSVSLVSVYGYPK